MMRSSPLVTMRYDRRV